MTDEQVARLAAGLTKAQLEAIVDATDMMSNHGGYPFVTVEHTGEPWPQGVAQFQSIWRDRLTETGLAVRAHLVQEKPDA
jgi:hypothetical protein